MRTTLDIAEDVLQAAKELARRDRKTAGAVISELARKALTTTPSERGPRRAERLLGFRPFPKRGGVLTNEMIDRLRDGESALHIV